MSATTFVPLRSRLIDEGEFMTDLDLELIDLQTAVLAFCKQHGEKAKDAKGKLVVEIEVKCENTDDNVFSIKTSMKATHPKRPASVSMAMGGTDDDGKLALFVRKSGSDDDHPRQLKLSTKNGRVIDPKTGEVLDNQD